VPEHQTLTAFTVEPGEPMTTKNDCPSTQLKMARTAWYQVKGSGGGIDLSTAGSSFDTVLAVYRLGAATPLVCADDTSTNTQAEIPGFATTSGTIYEVQVGLRANHNCPTATGCQLALEATKPNGPANDARATPVAVAAGQSLDEDTSLATAEPAEPLVCPGQSSDGVYDKTVWFRFSAPANGQAVFRASGYDTLLAVYPASATTFSACNDDDGTSFPAGPSRLAVDVAAGDYLVQVGGVHGANTPNAPHTLTFSADFTAAPSPAPGGGNSGGGGGSTGATASADAGATAVPPALTPAAPTCTAATPKAAKAGSAGVRVTIGCDVAATVAVAGTATPPATAAVKKPKPLRIAPVTGTSTAGVPLALTVTLPGKAGAAFKRGKRVKLALTLAPRNAAGAGPTSTLNRTVKGLRKAPAKPKR
jgi:hypothetical protein